MRKNRFLSLIAVMLLMLAFTLDASAVVSHKAPRQKQYKHRVINAPLDGGILSLLAVAGVSYFVIRRRKK